MKYVLKQKIFSLGDDFTIEDESGRDCYFVDGKAISIGDQLVIEDMQQNPLVHIKQKVLSFGKTYEISRSGKKVATVKKKHFTLFREVFDVEDAAAGDLDAEGDFFDREYRFTRDGATIARISKKFFSWSDTYGIDISEGEDDVLLLAVAVVIDQCCHDD